VKAIQMEGIYLFVAVFVTAVVFFGFLGGWMALKENKGKNRKRAVAEAPAKG
jgi:Na+/H+ antiporter NhaC